MNRSSYGRGGTRDRDADRYGREPRSGRDYERGGYDRGGSSRSGRADYRDPYGDPYADEPGPGRRTGGGGSSGGNGGGKGPAGKGGGGIQLNMGSIAVLAGVLIVGIGIGTGISSTTQGDQGNIASSQQLDMAVPDPEFCRQWGASAFVMDIELYTTMNPSSSFVTQPALKPGCVIRRENWSVLQKEGAVTAEQMRQCKQRMNTFAYIGSVKDKPVVRCVYQTDISENKFLTKGVADDTVGVTPEADQF